jgi:hypothetical protein
MNQDQILGSIKEYAASTAEEFWDILSPQHYLFSPYERCIFRGQSDYGWDLKPSILRNQNHPIHSTVLFRSSPETSDSRIFAEIATLSTFASYCDSTGLRIPFDSTEFRTKFLDPTNVMDSFIFHRRLWPSPEYYELMALAQHHGLPTRLLDWSHKSYVAAYFAASEALSNKVAERLAVWALNTQYTLPRLTKMEIIRVPGSNNANVAAQAGVFTLLRQEYTRGKPFDGPECLCDYAVSSGSNSLMKITLPLAEAPKIIDLCERHGITAAILFPDFYGAARATLDNQACWSRAEWTDGSDIRAKTTYALTPSANGVSDKS